MALKITGLQQQPGVFSFDGTNDPTPTDNAMGGTELQRKWLYENVDNDLLDKFQIISSRIRDLDDKPKFLWCHDLARDPEAEHLKDKESRDRFEKLIFVSNWQRQEYEYFLGVPPSQSVVLKNAIYPIIDVPKPQGTINIIYHTTPHRGLNILVPVFLSLAEQFDIHLDVYSSFNVYGWGERDAEYEPLFQQCRDHPKITYHGAQPNSVIRKALTKSHIFAYPSIWQETSCIAAMEAMTAKNIIVCPNLAALPETTANFAWGYQWDENINRHAQTFANTLAGAIVNCRADGIENFLNIQKTYTDQFYSWDIRKNEWEMILKAADNG